MQNQVRSKWIGSLAFDGLSLVLLGIWLNGGVIYQGHPYLKHGADPRRALILMGLLGYWGSKNLKTRSLMLRSIQKLAAYLLIREFRWSIYFLGVCGAVLVSLEQTWAMRVPLWDVGIFHQILWSLGQGLGFHSTISGAGNFLGDHFSPALILLVPFFKIFNESPLFLPVLQVLLIFGGGAAWLYLAEKFATKSLAASVVVFILSFESFWRNLRWGFHENALAFCSISWALALIFSNALEKYQKIKNSLIFALLLISAGSKEILLLNVAIGLVIWQRRENARTQVSGEYSRESSWVAACGLRLKSLKIARYLLATGLLVVFVFFEKMEHPAGKNYFNRYYAYLGGSLPEFLKNLILSPSLIFQEIGFKALMKYVWVVFSPWLLLFPVFFEISPTGGPERVQSRVQIRLKKFPPLGQGEGVWLWMILPSFASAALSSFPPLRNPGFHYVLELWPVLACVTIVSLGKQKSSSLAWTWAFFSLVSMDSDPFQDFRDYQTRANHQSGVQQLIETIPPGASLIADELAGTWVSSRKYVTRWPDVQLLPGGCPDYFLREAWDTDLTGTRPGDLGEWIRLCKKGQKSQNGQEGSGASEIKIREVGRTEGWVLYKRF